MVPARLPCLSLPPCVDGKDPVAERRGCIDAPIVNDLLDPYVAEHVETRKRPRTRDEVKRPIECHIRPTLGRHKVAAVTRQDMAKTAPRPCRHAPAGQFRAGGVLEGIQPRRGVDGTNPSHKIERYKENARERFLSAEELARLGATLRHKNLAMTGLYVNRPTIRCARSVSRLENELQRRWQAARRRWCH
jgi:hypothetical protein